MSDFDFPPDLLELQRAFFAADARCRQISDELPSAADVIAGVDVDYTELDAARRAQADAAAGISGHPWLASVTDRLGAQEALRKTARGK